MAPPRAPGDSRQGRAAPLTMLSFLARAITGNNLAEPRVVSPLSPLPVTFSATGNNVTVFRLAASLATNNAASVIVGPASVFSISGRITAGSAFLKLFNTAGVPNPAVDVPEAVYPLLNTSPIISFPVPVQGLFFPLGIGLALVAGAADLNNTPVAAGQVVALQLTVQPSL